MQTGLGSYAFRWAVGTPAFRPSEAMTVLGMINETAELGVGLLQVADNRELDEASPQLLKRVARHASQRGVSLQVGTSGASPERLTRYLKIATAVDADVVRVVLHGAGHNPTLRDAETALRAAAPDFEAAGVRIGIENHFMTPSRDLVTLVEHVGSVAVGTMLDTANSVMSGEWPAATVALLAPYAVGLHFKDYAIVPDHEGVGGHVVGRPLGEGWMDLPAVLDAVAHRDNDGSFGVVLEHWLPRGRTEQETLTAEHEARVEAVAAAGKIVQSWVESHESASTTPAQPQGAADAHRA